MITLFALLLLMWIVVLERSSGDYGADYYGGDWDDGDWGD